jgi:hypothetical protein
LPVYACNKDMTRDGQILKGRSGIIKRDRAWSVACEELDRSVVKRLCDLARYDGDLSARIKTFWDRRASEGVSRTQLLKLQIDKAEAQIRRLDQLRTDPATPLSAETERRYIEALRETEADAQRLRAALTKQQAESKDPNEIVANFYSLLANLAAQFPRLPLDSQKRVMLQVIREITLDTLSAHLFLQKRARKPLGFSRGMNAPSTLPVSCLSDGKVPYGRAEHTDGPQDLQIQGEPDS